MNDKRKYVRKAISIDVEYDVSVKQAWVDTNTKDIGAGGLCLKAATLLEKGTELDLKIRLPERDEPILAAGRVVWNQLIMEPKASFYYIGIEFVRIPQLERDSIRKFVEGTTFDKK